MKEIVMLGVVLLVIACQQPTPATKGPIEGAWKVAEFSYTAPDTSYTNTSPQPSLYLFAKQHYSIMVVTGTQPRVLFKERFQPTDSEKLAAYDYFVANSGTYEVTDSTITTNAIVAKSPNVMAGGSLPTYTYRVKGDSLWLTWSSIQQPEAKSRAKLVRLE